MILGSFAIPVAGLPIKGILSLPFAIYASLRLLQSRDILDNKLLPAVVCISWPGLYIIGALLMFVWPPGAAMVGVLSAAGFYLALVYLLQDWSRQMKRKDLMRTARILEKLWLYLQLPVYSILLWTAIHTAASEADRQGVNIRIKFNAFDSGGNVIVFLVFMILLLGICVSFIWMLVAYAKVRRGWQRLLASRRMRFADEPDAAMES